MSNRHRYLTADVTWAEEKNGALTPADPAPVRYLSETLAGCSQCADCGMTEFPCMCCLECGAVTDRVLARGERCCTQVSA